MILRDLLALWTSGARPMGDHLWQSTLFLAVAAILALALRKNQARVRYWVWLTASVKFLIPFSLLIALGSYLAKPRVSTPAQVIVYSAVEDFSQPFAGQQMPVIFHPAPTAAPVSLLHLLPAMVVAVWLVGIIVVLLRWVIGWVRISLMVRKAASVGEGPEIDALRRLESSLGVRTPIRLVLSPDWMEPGIFGIFRPVLIWPEGISQHLDDRHIEAILAHEVCHARRYDNLTAVLHMLVEGIFWFHPLVWWVGTRLEEERERACDEEVSLLCNEPHVYAESILKVCKFCSESPLACVSGITGADLKKRIMQIMTERVVRKLDLGRKLLLLAVGLLVVAVPIVLGQAKAAQRFAYAMLKSAPAPLRSVAHAMIAEEQTPSTGSIAEVQADAGAAHPGVVGADAAASLPRFEVASIHPSDPKGGPIGIFNYPGGRLGCSQCTLKYLMMEAFNLQSWQIDGGPDWTDPVKGDRYDIQAKAPQDSPVSRVSPPLTKTALNAEQREMLEGLLIDRFQLKFHRETRQGPVYLLERGSKPLLLEPPKDANEYSWAGGVEGGAVYRGTGLAGTNIAMPQLAARLSGWLHRPVVDQTGLKGAYDFRYETGDNAPDADVADAIQYSLQAIGLKVVAAKGQVEAVVVDSAKRPSVDGSEVVREQGSGNTEQTGGAGAAAYVPRMTFDVASVRVASETNFRVPMGGPGWTPHSTHVQWTFTIGGILNMAYGVNSFQLTGVPNWTTVFAIEAKGDTEADAKMAALPIDEQRMEQQHMLQALLEERFKLKTHWETREGDTYNLVVAKGGPKLGAEGSMPPSAEELKNFGDHPVPPLRQKGDHGLPEWVGNASPMGDLASILGAMFGRPVIGKTGLAGKYDFVLKYKGRWDSDRSADDMEPTPPLDRALQEELGLKVEQAKGPVKVLVIDHIEKPSEN